MNVVDPDAPLGRDRELAEVDEFLRLTNRQIADRAFVSPKTVEANLSRVYAKLGVRSRTQLVRALADADQGHRAGS